MMDASAVSGSQQLQSLLMRMAGKDEAAFEKLYAATKRKLFSAALAIVKRRHLAEEVIQEAYVRIWLNAGSYRPSLGTPMLWMIIIARNLAIDLVRRPAREIVSDDTVLWSFPADSPTPLEAIEISEDQAGALMHQLKVEYALQALDPNATSPHHRSLHSRRKPKAALATIRRAGQYHQDLDQAGTAGNPRQPAECWVSQPALTQQVPATRQRPPWTA